MSTNQQRRRGKRKEREIAAKEPDVVVIENTDASASIRQNANQSAADEDEVIIVSERTRRSNSRRPRIRRRRIEQNADNDDIPEVQIVSSSSTGRNTNRQPERWLTAEYLNDILLARSNANELERDNLVRIVNAAMRQVEFVEDYRYYVNRERFSGASEFEIETPEGVFAHGVNQHDPTMTYEELLSLGDRMGKVESGFSKDELSRLPVITFQQKKSVAETESCSICMDDYKKKDKLSLLNPCTHKFHKTCISKWLKSNKSCPICRVRVQINL